MTDHDPLAPDRPVLGGGRPARPIGLDSSGDEPVPLEGKPGGKPPATKGVELNIVADFPNQYGSIANEVQMIKASRWGPTIDDFNVIVVNALKCDSFSSFSAAILMLPNGQDRPNKSIRRINVFTHSNPDLIAFKGTEKSLTIGVDVQLEVNSGLNDASLQTWNSQGFFLENPTTKKKYTLADIRSRFTGKDAEIWLYACHSGVDGKLLQDTANTFQATVIGFQDAIAYCPTFTENPPTIDRKRVAIKTCGSGVTTDFRTLNTGTVKKTP